MCRKELLILVNGQRNQKIITIESPTDFGFIITSTLLPSSTHLVHPTPTLRYCWSSLSRLRMDLPRWYEIVIWWSESIESLILVRKFGWGRRVDHDRTLRRCVLSSWSSRSISFFRPMERWAIFVRWSISVTLSHQSVISLDLGLKLGDCDSGHWLCTLTWLTESSFLLRPWGTHIFTGNAIQMFNEILITNSTLSDR